MGTADTIWTYLLSGLVWFMNTFALPLFGDATSESAAMNFGKTIFTSTYIATQLIWQTIGSVVNLKLFGLFLGVILATFFLKVALASWKSIMGIIPFVGGR